jgi:transcriptional regulator with XRE-family HTH domain
MTHPVPRFNGRRLRARREALGLTKAQLAARADLSRAALKAMEQNRIRPSAAAFERLCVVFRLSYDAGRAELMQPGSANDHRLTELDSSAAGSMANSVTGRRAPRVAMGQARRERRRDDG